MCHAPSPYRLPSHLSPYQLLYKMPRSMRNKIHHFWITSNDHFYKTNLFVFKPKAFWMLHLNDYLYKKLTCLVVGSKFLVSCRRLRTPRHFYGISPLELCLTTNISSFTRWGIHSCLLLPDTSFLYHFIQP